MRLASIIPLLSLASCATYWQADRMEEQINRLVENTNRNTLTQIFGEQATAITQKMDTLDAEQKEKLDELIESYQRGNSSLEDVRSSVLNTMGGADRVVSSSQGIWVRNEEGKKTQAVGRNTKIKNCAPLKESDLPAAIATSKGLASMSWGRGELNGKTVVFPWELTMSAFAKEIVENTARRTAQEFIRMTGDKGWSRPVYIQVVTEPGKNLKVTHPGAANEVYVTTPDQPAPAPGEPPQPVADPAAKQP